MTKENPTFAKTSTGAAAVTQLTLTVFRLNGLLLHCGDRLVEPLGLTSARWQVLGAIALAGVPLTAPKIGEAMGVTRQGAQKQLNVLAEQGLVEARPNPAHRRSPQYILTPLGLVSYPPAASLWPVQAGVSANLISIAPATSASLTPESMPHPPQFPKLYFEIES